MIKLSNFWENWDIFTELVKESGKSDSLHKLRIIKTFFNANGEFEGNWENLLNNVLTIFINDKILARKFDYTNEQRTEFQRIFKSGGSEKRIFVNKLNELLSKNYYKGKQWNTPTAFYDKINYINLIDKSNFSVVYYCEIKTNIKDKTNFNVIIKNNDKIIGNLLVIYENKKYKHTINLDTGRKTQISRYAEIIHFINSNVFMIFIEDMSYYQFKYLALSFVRNYSVLVPIPSIKGELDSSGGQNYISTINDLNKYFKLADKSPHNNSYHIEQDRWFSFKIHKPTDEANFKLISDLENEWGNRRSDNGSRKGPIN